ncbi:acetyl-CoA hydrolase/transferase C-terminal domain-containing protein [soil metagenome]
MREIALDSVNFAELVRPGDRVAWTSGTAEPFSLSERLVAQRHDVGALRLLLGTLYGETLTLDNVDGIAIEGLGGVGKARALASAGVMDVLPNHMSDFATLIRTRRLPVDVAIVQVAEDPQTGALSYGAVNGYGPDLIDTARTVIAEINSNAPFSHATTMVPRERIALAARSDRPLIDLPEAKLDDVSIAIGRHVASLVPDGACLQIGVGSIPGAVLAALEGHKDLGLHSGTIGDSVIPLIERGVITNARKPIDRGVSVTGTLTGTRKIYDFAHRNPDLRIEPVSVTHELSVLAQLDGLATINSAIEIDLTGQVNAEVIGRHYVGAVGGQVDFVRGARAAKGGVSIFALPATTAKGASKIVPTIASGIVTTARADVDYVVTEYGIARLSDCGLGERARRLIAIAHPDHREFLEQAARSIPGGLPA